MVLRFYFIFVAKGREGQPPSTFPEWLAIRGFLFHKLIRMFAVSGEAIRLTGTKASGLCPDLDEMLGRLSTQHFLYISEKWSFAMRPALTDSTRLMRRLTAS